MLSAVKNFFAPRPLDAAGIPGYKKIGLRVATRAYANGLNGRIDNFGIGNCRAGGLTDKAAPQRSGNEDGLLVARRTARGQKQVLLTVADGIGGFESGEVASAIALNLTAKYFCLDAAGFNFSGVLAQTSDWLANWRIRIGQPNSNAGTTFVGGLVDLPTGNLDLAHIGDARAYLLRGDHLYMLTKDDNYLGSYLAIFSECDISSTFNALIELLGPKPEAAYNQLIAPFSPEVSKLLHDVNLDYYNNETFGGRISKAVGASDPNGPPPQPSFLRRPLQKDDILVLMSDGVHDFIAYDPLKQAIASARRGTPLQIADSIFGQLQVLGDNVTLAVYKHG